MAALLYCLLTPMLGLSTVHTGVARVRCTRVRCIHASAPNDAHEAHMREVQKLHAGIADASASAGGAGSSLTEHNKRQSAVFDEASAFFASADATPPDVVPLLREIVAAAELAPGSSVLDVGTGTGALVPFYEELGLSQGSITGVDLSPKMIAYAAERYPEANFLCADILAVSAPGAFDAVVINACFGNMHDQQLVLEHAASLVRTGGRVLIAHPLGASFVEQLQQDDPGVVPHSLPTRDSLLQMSLGTPLRLERFEAEEGKPYVALLNRSPVAPLPKLRALRGAVATGFGRGSKKLGVPTANLPCSLFQDELDDLERGVYIGGAAVRGEVHKCVANVGFSPTFADEQNPEKIVEAHILNQFDGDFYGEVVSPPLFPTCHTPGFLHVTDVFLSFRPCRCCCSGSCALSASSAR